MEDYQEQVIQEKADLDLKIEKLNRFVSGETFQLLDSEEQQRMTEQLSYMNAYSEVLGRRIVEF